MKLRQIILNQALRRNPKITKDGALVPQLDNMRYLLRAKGYLTHQEMRDYTLYFAAYMRQIFKSFGVDISDIDHVSTQFGTPPPDITAKALKNRNLLSGEASRPIFDKLDNTIDQNTHEVLNWLRDALSHVEQINRDLIPQHDRISFERLIGRDLRELELAWRASLSTGTPSSAEQDMLARSLGICAGQIAGIIESASETAKDKLDIIQRFMIMRYGE